MALNLKKVDVVSAANKGATVDIVDPVTGDVTGAKITVVGSDSDLYRKAQRKILNKRLNEKKGKTRAEELEAESLELLAQCTTGWEGIEDDGTPLTFSIDAARKLYKEFPFIKEQIDAAIADRALFLGN